MSEYEKLHQRIAQLVERNEQLGVELECALGDVATAKGIINRQCRAFESIRDSLQHEYWSEYAGLDGTREILDAAIDLSFESERT